MRKITTMSLALIVAMGLLVGCGDGNDDPEPINNLPPTGEMTPGNDPIDNDGLDDEEIAPGEPVLPVE